MDLDLKGKRALVCGSSQGIGKAAAIELARLGADVTLFARNRESLQVVLKELPDQDGQKHQLITADFSNPEEVEAALNAYLQEFPVNHILINNTGGPPGGQAIEADTGEFHRAFDTHLIANQIITQKVVGGMRQSGYGRIINIISTSVKAPIRGLGVSNTIRGAVANWAKTLSVELGPDGITVNNVLPGATSTARLDSIVQRVADNQNVSEEAVAENMKQTIPARRFASPQEVAYAVAFLASPSASYINGINLPVDGGRTPSL